MIPKLPRPLKTACLFLFIMRPPFSKIDAFILCKNRAKLEFPPDQGVSPAAADKKRASAHFCANAWFHLYDFPSLPPKHLFGACAQNAL
jgi:hypothetical protein